MIVQNSRFRNSNKIFWAIAIHFPIFMALYSLPFFLPHNLLPFLDWFPFPIERWLVWVVPSIFLIKIFEKELYIGLKEMFFNKVKLKTFLWCFLPIVLWLAIGYISSYFGVSIVGRQLQTFESANELFKELSQHSWGTLTVPAIPEEIVFRAWMQNALMGRLQFKRKSVWAIVISNLLFVVIHLPVYIFVYFTRCNRNV